MEKVDFYELSRVVQDRLVASTRGTDVPAPILRIGGTGDRLPAIWLVVSVAAAAGFAGLLLHGFGDAKSAFSIQTPAIAGIEAALAVIAVLGVLQAFARWSRVKVWPFRPGVYLFGGKLVDARSHVLRVAPMEELTIDDATDAIRVRAADGTSFVFSGSRDAAQHIADARTEVKELGPRPDPGALVRLDPLYEPRFSSPLGPKHPFKHVLPAWLRARFVVAAIVGVFLGGGAWFVRNTKSDDKMFEIAKKKDDVESYKAYLEHGTRHQSQVSSELLPRAELRVAIATGTVDAIEAYIQAHPSTRIGDEVANALRTAMLAELEKAKEPGTLAALDAFAKAHPDHHLDAELAAAIHGVYAASLEKFKAGTPTKGSADEIAFVTKLLAWSEKKGPAVQVRYRYAPSKGLKTVDKVVGKNAAFMGEQSYPSKYFGAADLRPREEESGKTISDRFAQAFAPELLAFSLGPPFDDAESIDAPPPSVTVPTLIVSHTEDWSGTAFESKTPRGIFVGIKITFDALFVIPGDAKPYKLHYVAMRNVDPTQLKELGKEYPAKVAPEKIVYGTMAKDSFDLFTKRLLDSFFAK